MAERLSAHSRGESPPAPRVPSRLSVCWMIGRFPFKWMRRRLTLSVPPIVERVKLPLYRSTALLSSLFEIPDGPHDVRVAHVPRNVIILVHGEDAGVPLVQVMKRL